MGAALERETSGRRRFAPLRFNGEPYSGINVLLLWSESMARGISSQTWMTFRQAVELGGHVRKGECGSIVVCANRIRKTETDGRGEEVEREIPFLKAYTVFNVAQIDGLPEIYSTSATGAPVQPIDGIPAADAFFTGTGATVRHGGDKAFYAPGPHMIQRPPIETFRDVGSYYPPLPTNISIGEEPAIGLTEIFPATPETGPNGRAKN